MRQTFKGEFKDGKSFFFKEGRYLEVNTLVASKIVIIVLLDFKQEVISFEEMSCTSLLFISQKI
ncbi:hypothetical protein [Caldisericum sp. AR60]|uniref:hypothetical protein n=1 Tax=Caldisericum sp. AR60 TaxID=3397852 RepID=UPI0039FD8341